VARSLDERLSRVRGDITFKVTGLTKAVRALEKAGTDAGELKDLMHSLGEIVVKEARGRVPSESGALLASIRAGRGKTKSVVRAGGARVPYAGVIHYGWPAHNIKPSNYLTDALNAKRGEVLNRLDEGISELLRKNHLK